MVIAFGMSSTIALDTDTRKQVKTKEMLVCAPVFGVPLSQDAGIAQNLHLTSVEVLLIFGSVVSGVPMMVFTVLAHLNDEAELVVPLVALHSS